MAADCDKACLINIQPELASLNSAKSVVVGDSKKESVLENPLSKRVSDESARKAVTVTATQNEATEKRQKTGRCLAIGVTLIMLFIAFYHTLLRHATVLAGLLAPAIIMLLYILWLFYFAKKKKTTVSAV